MVSYDKDGIAKIWKVVSLPTVDRCHNKIEATRWPLRQRSFNLLLSSSVTQTFSPRFKSLRDHKIAFHHQEVNRSRLSAYVSLSEVLKVASFFLGNEADESSKEARREGRKEGGRFFIQGSCW